MQILLDRAALAVAFMTFLGTPPAPAQTDFRAQAFAAHKNGDLNAAADLFMKLFAAGAADHEVLATGAATLEKTGRYNDALDLLARGKEKFPEDALFRIGLARVFNLKAASLLSSLGKMDTHVVFNFQDSVREGEAVLRRDPGNRDARLIVANSLYALGEWDKVRPHAQSLIERFPDHPGGYIMMGDLAFEHYKHQRQRADEQGSDAAKDTALKMAGALAAARKSYSKAIELDPKRAIAHRKLGDVCAWNGEAKEATEHYADALGLNPQARVSHEWIGKTLAPAERAKWYEAIGRKYLEGSGDKAGSALFAWYTAAALTAQREHKRAEEAYAAAVALNPKYAQAYYYAMYSAYFYRDDAAAAQRYAAAYAKVRPIEFSDTVRAIEAEQREPIVQLIKFLAKRAMDEGDAAASRDLNHTLAAIVDTADAWNNFAFMARESGMYEASETAYRHALELEPTSGQLMNDLGVILHYHTREYDKWKEAESLYVEAKKRAEAILADARASGERKAAAAVTQRDATNNLEALRAAFKTIGPKLRRKPGGDK